ncbi:MAG TPA: PIG-L family deacetylase [Bacillota bacterium]|nr:PIG-L family deacetylase [Bacillota bacterium]
MPPLDQCYIPDGSPVSEALSRTTHLGIAAHPDDLEIMASHGILECYHRQDQWFFGTIVTNGAGSPRSGPYAAMTDEEMITVRRKEQEKAAALGGYSGVAFQNYSSVAVKSNSVEQEKVIDELQDLIEAVQPRIVYTHNPSDRHETHVAVALCTIQAIRRLPKRFHPNKIYGCEVWGGLDWVPESARTALPLSRHIEIASSALNAHDSQIAGGKRYDLAAQGRWAANATFSQSHEVDHTAAVTFALDLTPLIADETLRVSEYISEVIERFKEDTIDRIIRNEKGAVVK